MVVAARQIIDTAVLEKNLRGALARKEFHLEYQPIVNLETNQICCCEALLRWESREGEWIAPSTFIPVAESNELIIPIGAWALHEACSEAAKWPSHVRVAVNVSAVQLRTQGFTKTIRTALAESGLEARRLEIEITESVLLGEGEEIQTALERIRAMGVRIVLDDFGTGYCSFAYLRRFAFDKIKIDRSFTRDVLSKDPYSRIVMRALVRLGSALGIDTTAEGVATKEQLFAVRAEGCTQAQGFLFSPAKPPAEIRELLAPGRQSQELKIERSWSQMRKLHSRSPDELVAEEQRLRALYQYDVLDTPAEESFDRITRLALLLTQSPIAMVSLVDRDRQWFKSRQGFEVAETARDISFCTHTIRCQSALVVPDALNDPRFCNSPLVTGTPHIRSYVGVPLRTPDGYNIGALCINDTKPRQVTKEQIDALQDLAMLVVDELELRKQVTVDVVTGALSRGAFLTAGNKEIERARRSSRELGCIVLDVGRFKEGNNTDDNCAGDTVLREIFAACRAEIRNTDLIGRIGEEKCAVLLPNTSGPAAAKIAKKLRAKIALLVVKHPSYALHVSASFGVANLKADDAGMKDVLKRADPALVREEEWLAVTVAS